MGSLFSAAEVDQKHWEKLDNPEGQHRSNKAVWERGTSSLSPNMILPVVVDTSRHWKMQYAPHRIHRNPARMAYMFISL
jgi:hypothetical protein